MDDDGRTAKVSRTSQDHRSVDDGTEWTRRRRFLAGLAAAGTAGIAGCDGLPGDGGGDDGDVTLADFRGSGPLVEQRDQPGGTSIEELPDLSGTLTVYLGGGEGGLYTDLFDLLERIYEEFTVDYTTKSSSDFANQILEEADAAETQADVFLAVDAGSLGAVAEAGVTTALPAEAFENVPSSFHDSEDRWVGVAGRARAVPYNTDALSESDIPSTVQEFPETEALQDSMAWGPSYGAFQSFVTAMRLLRGDEETGAWLEAMLDAGVTEFRNEWYVSNRVADGEVDAGFANHYYAQRVRNSRTNEPIDLAFTEGDAGALVNVSGATVLGDTAQQELADTFVRHLLSAEVQEFFATQTFAYPTVSEVQPVGGLPTTDELNPPDVDLTELSDTAGTLDLLREVGVL